MEGMNKKWECVCCKSREFIGCVMRLFLFLVRWFYGLFLVISMKVHPLLIQICYFVCLSLFGLGVLKAFGFRIPNSSSLSSSTSNNSTNNIVSDLDLFFTSVSAVTVSSMSTVEMENLSNSQLVVLTLLMLVGGEVFTSMVGLLFKLKLMKNSSSSNKFSLKLKSIINNTSSASITPAPPEILSELEMEDQKNNKDHISPEYSTSVMSISSLEEGDHDHREELNLHYYYLKHSSIKYLGLVVLSYQVVIQGIGVIMVSLYMSLVSSAKEVLHKKGIKIFTFSVFTIVSTFSSCGFIPTNENMMVFAKHWALLLILIPQALVGNTLFPPCLRLWIWVMGKLFKKTKETNFLLNPNSDEDDNDDEGVGYKHLLPRKHSRFLVVTVFVLILVQVILFCSLDWNSQALEEQNLNSYEKVIGVTFQSVNSRHTGETILDLSIVSPAILVLFVFMMYLPPYTSFLPIKEKEGEIKREKKGKKKRRRRMFGVEIENLVFSQLSYLTMFIIMVCITERRKLKEDPLNFSVLNIVIEVISAYGNVGFTSGYSCERRINNNNVCQDKWYGFVGKWSPQGKIILIIVMLFGRLKKFNMRGGKPWILL